jgi:hypothetical protein
MISTNSGEMLQGLATTSQKREWDSTFPSDSKLVNVFEYSSSHRPRKKTPSSMQSFAVATVSDAASSLKRVCEIIPKWNIKVRQFAELNPKLQISAAQRHCRRGAAKALRVTLPAL